MSDGISIVVCCQNSAKRLPETLWHLARQRDTHGVSFELVLVDNGSSDGTASVATQLWAEAARQIPMQVVQETELGLSYARSRGIREAKHDIISFVDDDNWVSSDWVAKVHELLASKPDVAACGGQCEAVCESSPPDWFQTHQASYAVGQQALEAGDVTWTRGFLWGAGLSVRRKALARLFERGFRPALEDRKGKSLTAGGDSEQCLALCLAGWKLYYDPALRLKHYMPSARLNWDYLRRLHRGFGRSKPVLDLYHKASLPERHEKSFRRHWWWQSLRLMRLILTQHGQTLKRYHLPLEGNREILALESLLGRLTETLRLRSKLAQLEMSIRNAKWRTISSQLPPSSQAVSPALACSQERVGHFAAAPN